MMTLKCKTCGNITPQVKWNSRKHELECDRCNDRGWFVIHPYNQKEMVDRVILGAIFGPNALSRDDAKEKYDGGVCEGVALSWIKKAASSLSNYTAKYAFLEDGKRVDALTTEPDIEKKPVLYYLYS